MKPFKLNSDGQHDLTTDELATLVLETYDHERDAAIYGANARSLADEVGRLRARVEALERALREAADALANEGYAASAGNARRALKGETP